MSSFSQKIIAVCEGANQQSFKERHHHQFEDISQKIVNNGKTEIGGRNPSSI